MGWGNIYKRRLKVFAVALIIYIDYKALQQRAKWANVAKKTALWEKAHERNARRLLNCIVELEGLWVKLGQYLSTRADVLPQAYIILLRQLQDSLPPRSLEEVILSFIFTFFAIKRLLLASVCFPSCRQADVCRTIEKELGNPMDQLFSNFVRQPLATASIAQVHRATLMDGQEVVVKVQHEGVKKVILEDLKNAKSIIDWIAWAEPQYDFNAMIDEWCKEAPKELDFRIEAENTKTVSKNLGCKNKDERNPAHRVDVLIPEVIQATETVLVLEYMDGIRLNDTETLESFGVDKQKIVEEITRAYAHQIYIDGFFNGDPHPGNFLVSKESPHRPILLDFGLTKRAMGIVTVFFRNSAPAAEAHQTVKSLTDQRDKNMKAVQEKMKLNQKEAKRFNPVDAFPGDIVIFSRVLNLLRGLSSTMNIRIVYLDIMRPFAESVLQGDISKGPAANPQWIYDSPVHSDVEAKLRQLLIKLGNDNKILGIQVCAYKDGEVIIDTAAGVLGRYDPRPVQNDSLFPVFSVSKGITAGMLHWLVDNGKLKLDENVANIWPEFGSSRKDQIKVHHVLNHTSGLHNALADLRDENAMLMINWDECLKRIALTEPETAPGQEQLYHYLSFGWLCGGIIEHASGKKFQEILEEAIVRPLNIEGEMYIGIPPGVESRLANLTPDTEDLNKLATIGNRADFPSSFQPDTIVQLANTLPMLFNMLNTRRAIIPAANGHCSARALARYYAALADGGIIPPPHSSSSKPPLGSHPHIPKFSSEKSPTKHKLRGVKDFASALKNRNFQKNYKQGRDLERAGGDSCCSRLVDEGNSSHSSESSSSDGDRQKTNEVVRIFGNPNIRDSFMGVGEYEHLTFANGKFGLGFKRVSPREGSIIGFGHSGMGGSTGFCDINNRFAIAVTLNKMSVGGTTGKIVNFVCSELNIPVPEEYARFAGPEVDSNFVRPLIN
ncbi:hypothetical protein ACFE04_000898 [Oxalis oulophora]